MWKTKEAHVEAGTPIPEIVKHASKPKEKNEEVEGAARAEQITRKQLQDKLSAVQGANQQRRTRKHTKELVQKTKAAATADRELVTKEMIAQAKQALEADEKARARAADLTTDKV